MSRGVDFLLDEEIKWLGCCRDCDLYLRDQRLRGGDVVVESRKAGPHDVSDDP